MKEKRSRGDRSDLAAAALRGDADEPYRALFRGSPIAFWVEDRSALKRHLEELRRSGVADVELHLERRPSEVDRCLQLIDLVEMNAAAERLVADAGWSGPERELPVLLHRANPDFLARQIGGLERGADLVEADLVLADGRGGRIDLRARVSVAAGAEETWARVVVSLTDIGEWKRAQAQLQLHQVAMESSADAIFITRRDGRIEWVNGAFSRSSGYSRTEAVGRTPRLLRSDRHDEAYFRRLWETLLSGQPYRNRTVNRHKSGSLYTVEQSITPIFDDGGEITHFVAVQQDITDRLASEEQLVRLVQQDFLTDLPNRYAFTELLEREAAVAGSHGRSVAVLLLDIDHFKDINDVYGHTVGDELLMAAADRLRESLRSLDSVARLGGDEFAVLQTDVSELEDTAALAERLLRILEEPFDLGERRASVSASIGIAVSAEGEIEPTQMIQQADVALYRAKSEGRSNYRFHTAEMDREVEDRLTLCRELRRAMEGDDLFLVFQPQIDLETGRVVALEALARWRHPKHGLIPPGRFIPIAESSGLIVPLGEWVLRAACHTLRKLREDGQSELSMAVNVSAVQLKARGFADVVRRTLDDTGLPPEALEIELTESVLMQQTRQLRHAVEELHDLGVRFSVDDFGTGYSSMMYLRQFAVDKLKIDRFFLERIESSPSDAAIVTAIIALGNQLGLQVLAEGVERETQIDFLQANGCFKVQGYYFSRPIPVADLTELLLSGSDRIRAAGSAAGEGSADDAQRSVEGWRAGRLPIH